MSVIKYHIFELQAPLKIPSVNTMYKPKSSFGKSFAWLYKDPKVESFQDALISSGTKSDLSDIKDLSDSINFIDIQFIFLLDKNYLKRDTSNMIKMTEDALMEVTKIDDSKHRKVTAVKALSYIPKKEFIICKYEVFLNEDQ